MVVVYGKSPKDASGKFINISRDFPSPLTSNRSPRRGAGAILKIPVDFSDQSDSLLPYAPSDLPAVNGLKVNLGLFF